METDLNRLHYSAEDAAAEQRFRRTAHRRRRALPRRLRQRRALPLAPHAASQPGGARMASSSCAAAGQLADRRSPDALVPPQFPSVAQSKLLLKNGVQEPVVRALTVISILEGFGAIIRDVRVPDLQVVVRRADRRHGARAPRARFVRSARARRGRLQGPGRPQADVGSRARPRAREPEGAGRRVPALDGRPRPGARGRPAVPGARQEAAPDAEHDGAGVRDRDVRTRARSTGARRLLSDPEVSARAAEGRRDGRLHPQPTSPARRVPAHGAVRGAHAHAAHRRRPHDRGQHRRRRPAAPRAQAHWSTTARASSATTRATAWRARWKPAKPSRRCSRSSIALAPSWTPPARTGFEAAA